MPFSQGDPPFLEYLNPDKEEDPFWMKIQCGILSIESAFF